MEGENDGDVEMEEGNDGDVEIEQGNDGDVEMEQIPFPTDPVIPPPNGCHIDILQEWVKLHQHFRKRLSKADFKIYDKQRRKRNTRVNRNKKMKTPEGRTHFSELSKVRSIHLELHMWYIIILYFCFLYFQSVFISTLHFQTNYLPY